MSDQELEGFSPMEADRVVKMRVCAQCWSDLSIVKFEGQFQVQVICPGCGESVEITGHVSKNTPTILMENAKFAYREVRYNLRDLFPSNEKKQTQEEILHSLGF